MKLNVYDKDLNRIAIIGTNYVSCLWSEGYNTVENFTVELRKTEDYMKKIRPGVYFGRNDRNTLMVVESVEVTGTGIIASGKNAARVLDDVAFIGTLAAGSDFPSEIKAAYDSGEKVGRVEFPAPTIEASYPEEVKNKSFLDLCEITCQSTDVGFRAVRSGSEILLEFYQPDLNPSAIYAEKYGNLLVERLTFSNAKYKNFCIVLGEDADGGEVRVEVDKRIGDEKRRELILTSSEKWEDTDTEDTYRARLSAEGAEKLLACQKTFECAFSPYADDFGSKFDLGDVMTILLPDYGLRLEARVMRMTQKSQKNTIKTTIEVGQITITKKR